MTVVPVRLPSSKTMVFCIATWRSGLAAAGYYDGVEDTLMLSSHPGSTGRRLCSSENYDDVFCFGSCGVYGYAGWVLSLINRMINQ